MKKHSSKKFDEIEGDIKNLGIEEKDEIEKGKPIPYVLKEKVK